MLHLIIQFYFWKKEKKNTDYVGKKMKFSFLKVTPDLSIIMHIKLLIANQIITCLISKMSLYFLNILFTLLSANYLI